MSTRRRTDKDRIVDYFIDEPLAEVQGVMQMIVSIVRRRQDAEGKAPARDRPPGSRNLPKADAAKATE